VNIFLFSFFFQAEDGIRDSSVTGVQTCALPISKPPRDFFGSRFGQFVIRHARSIGSHDRLSFRCPATRRKGPFLPYSVWQRVCRSEERRVGKECRLQRERYALNRSVTGRSTNCI